MNDQVSLSELSAEQFLEIAQRHQLSFPVEAHPAFNEDGRKVYYLKVEEKTQGVVALIKAVAAKRGYYSVFWARSGPLFIQTPPVQVEIKVRDAVAAWARTHTNCTIYRYSAQSLLEGSKKSHEVGAYDTSVIIPLAESFDETLANLPKRGRRDLSRARRKSPLQIVDLSENLGPGLWNQLSGMMFESGKRSGFAAMRSDTLEKYVSPLVRKQLTSVYGAENEDGQLVGWAAMNIVGVNAYYYHAAATGEGLAKFAPDLLLNHLISVAVEHGCAELDLVGIGSELAPHLLHLNTFKTKFGSPVHVSFSQDYVLRRGRYLFERCLTTLRSLAKRILVRKK